MDNVDDILDKVIKTYEEGIKALEDEILNIKETIKSRRKDLAEYYEMKEKKMTKKENFLNICDKAIEQGKGIIVFVKIPRNKEEEVILNSAKDVLNKKEYYDKTYNDDLKHNHAPVEITDIKVEELGLNRVCDSLLINELDARGYTLKKESKLNHIERMELELSELSEKIKKEQQFLDKEYENPKFTDEVQRYSLEEQLKHMRGYREYLKGRISYDFLKQHKEQ